MALRINLFHEVLRNKKQQQYDPLKLSLYGVIVVAVGLIAWYFVEFGKYSIANGVAQAKQAELQALKPKEQKAKEEEVELEKQLANSNLLTKRMEERFYWAPVLDEIAACVAPSIQVTKLAGDISGEAMRKIQISMEGIAAGLEPRATAEELRIALVEKLKKYKNSHVAFTSLEDSATTVVLDSETLNTAAFAISITFNFGEEPPPPPPVRPGKGRRNVAQQ